MKRSEDENANTCGASYEVRFHVSPFAALRISQGKARTTIGVKVAKFCHFTQWLSSEDFARNREISADGWVGAA